ncbi:MAG: Gldg family protein [Clostridia bacterium]|nr:Gldg family protein [Clostridia bacterium]
MEEKKINEALENEDVVENASQTTEEIPAADKKKTKKDTKAFFARLKNSGNKKLKNQALFKKGGYAVAITACVLAGIIILNVLVGVLADRFNLEIDMTTAKQNSINEENVEYIKDIENEINIIFCATEEDYVGGAMSYYASNLYSVSDGNETNYYQQTINLVKKYADYNDKITVEFMDTQSSEFAAVASNYSAEKLNYGDIIVSATITGKDGKSAERHKIVTYEDIYSLADESGYAGYGYGGYTIGGNNIETALTSAISYVCTAETKKIALVTGHSSGDYTKTYSDLLKANNYEISVISDTIIGNISSDYDLLAIIAPSKDFLGSELDAISAFLDNNGKLDKGLICFMDATAPKLKNLNDFLLEWGIEISDGMLFETNEQNHVEADPYTMGIYPAEDKITSGMSYCISGYNVPMLAAEASSNITVTELMTTLESAVIAPKGSGNNWKGYKDSDLGTYAAVIQAEKMTYDNDNNKIKSYVMAFSSVEFIYSDWAEYDSLSNKNIALAVTDRAALVEDSGISFVSKTITSESFAEAVTEGNVNLIRIIFMILLPVAMIALGIFIFIRRKNA